MAILEYWFTPCPETLMLLILEHHLASLMALFPTQIDCLSDFDQGHTVADFVHLVTLFSLISQARTTAAGKVTSPPRVLAVLPEMEPEFIPDNGEGCTMQSLIHSITENRGNQWTYISGRSACS